MARDNLTWSEQALRAAEARGAPADVARARGTLGNALSRAAALPGEDRRGRLLAALAAYDEALKYRRADTAPLDYAMTQNNRANLLSEIAGLPGEDRRGRLALALACAWEAWNLFMQLEHAPYEAIARRTLHAVREECGDDFPVLWRELGMGAAPAWLSEAAVFADLQQAAQAAQQPDPLQPAWQAFVGARQQAEQDEDNPAAWQNAADAGEGVLAVLGSAPAGDETLHQVCAHVANTYNQLGRSLDARGDKAAALTAFERAIALQPDFAMWQRNRAGTLIELGRLDEAAATIARARELEPDAPRLADLDRDLAAARSSPSS